MPLKQSTALFAPIALSTVALLYFYSSLLTSSSTSPSQTLIPKSTISTTPTPTPPRCNLFRGSWKPDPNRRPAYDDSCPFHRNSWNCLRNKRDRMGAINSWKWAPDHCDLPRVDPVRFLSTMRNRNVGFVGDSLNENFLVGFLCVLRSADHGARKWKRRGAWRGAYFPGFNVTVAYHRAVLLAQYRWQPKKSNEDGLKGTHRVDVDIPADDWVNVTEFYDVLIFNTGHWWGYHKFPQETPLVFYERGEPIVPALEIMDGFKLVLKHMISYIESEVKSDTLKFWRLQSPRHFWGGEWNQNGSCLFDKPLDDSQLDLWFDPINKGVNKEERELNLIIEEALRGTGIEVLDLAHLSEYRADAHPAIWLGKKDAVAIWGQDCMHWCLPGLPDTWADILAQLINNRFTNVLTNRL